MGESEDKKTPLQNACNRLHKMSIITGIVAIVQLIIWATKDHHSFETHSETIQFVTALCSIALAFLCHYAATTQFWLFGVLLMTINTGLIGLQIYSITISIQQHNAVAGIVFAFIMLIFRVLIALLMFKFTVIMKKYANSDTTEYGMVHKTATP